MFKLMLLSVFYIITTSIIANHPGVTTGNEYLKVKDYEKSFKSFSDVLLEDGGNKAALYGKSYSLFKMKKYQEALDSFEVLLTIDKNYRDALYRTAFLYRKVKKYDKAIEYYKLYLKKSKNDPDSYYGLARTSEQKKDIVSASYYFYLYTTKETRVSEDKWVKKAQKKIEKYRARFTPEQQNKYGELVGKATIEVKKVVEIPEVKKTAGASKGEAVTHPETKPEKLDIPVKPKATTEKPKSSDKNLNYMFMKGVKGDDLYLSKKYNDAIIQYRAYLKDPSKRREGLYKMAVSNAMLKKYPTAVKLFSQIIIEEDDNDDVKELLKLLLVNKSVITSLKGATKAIKNKIGMGKVIELISRGDYYEAIKILDILISNIRNNSSALLYKVDLLRILSKNKEIDSNLKSFLAKNPNNILVNEKYGDFLSSQNKKTEAVTYYNLAMSKTDDKDIKERLKLKISK